MLLFCNPPFLSLEIIFSSPPLLVSGAFSSEPFAPFQYLLVSSTVSVYHLGLLFPSHLLSKSIFSSILKRSFSLLSASHHLALMLWRVTLFMFESSEYTKLSPIRTVVLCKANSFISQRVVWGRSIVVASGWMVVEVGWLANTPKFLYSLY